MSPVDRRTVLTGAAALAVAGTARAAVAPDLEALAKDPTNSAGVESVQERRQAARARLTALETAMAQTPAGDTGVVLASVIHGARSEVRLADFAYGDGGSVYPVTYRSGQHTQVTAGKASAAEIDNETARIAADTANGILQPDFLLKRALTAVETAQFKAEGEVQAALESQIVALTAQLAVAGDRPGVGQLPGGKDYYTAQLGLALSSPVDPKAGMKLARQRLDAIWDELDELLKRQGLKSGPAHERLQRFARDPRYLYPQSDTGRSKMVADMNRMLDDVLERLPDAFDPVDIPDSQVERMSPADELAGVQGKRSGTSYIIDQRRTRDRPVWTLPSVVHHELYPGHMLPPAVRPAPASALQGRYGASAWGEGWPIYAETVAAEIGALELWPEARIGFLHWQAFRTARIVADIGLHTEDWSREEAVRTLTRLQGGPIYFITIDEDIDRMCLTPGANAAQGLSTLSFLERRAVAAKVSGFDLKTFHRAAMAYGPVSPDGFAAALSVNS
ncbi:hypothetical protein ABAC460_05880 [Asticcacaulis sp. AC460]|uniref:DUF885 family protein n=1 Tax=Asticcacaulis sp. AC460 TaxID=1282360 RepID=UPI0003C3EC32|nr:DUF885 family protein [Asticcacaulis sp. AC460]ESQ91511.1 hypothetical protein ABAC460_05880 [Asticcacaulis sp. AC460]